jgi:hypothetical protein
LLVQAGGCHFESLMATAGGEYPNISA